MHVFCFSKYKNRIEIMELALLLYYSFDGNFKEKTITFWVFSFWFLMKCCWGGRCDEFPNAKTI